MDELRDIDILRDVVERLERAGLDYMLTGSMALNLYGVPRMTRDIDLVVALEPMDAMRVVELFLGDYYLDDLAVEDAIARRTSFNLIHEKGFLKVDVMVRKDEEYRHVELARRLRKEIEGFDAWVVAPEDLILSKLDWARGSRSERQLSDVRGLLASGRPLDHAYMHEWAGRLGLADLFDQVSS